MIFIVQIGISIKQARRFTSPYLLQLYTKKLSRWLSTRNASVSRNQGKITPSRTCAWFESKRFDCPSVSFFDHWPIGILDLLPLFCTELTLFCTVFKQKKLHCSSESRIFFMYIISNVTIFVVVHWELDTKHAYLTCRFVAKLCVRFLDS